MFRNLLPAGLLASALLFAGCDVVNTAINDALPEISVGDGVLGLDGETGVEMSADFAASKGASQATARFALTRTFDDLNTGDITKLRSLSTSLLLAANAQGSLITINRGSASSLPDAITIAGGSVAVSISDASSSFSLPASSFSNQGTLTRLSGCAADAASCGYVASGTSAFVLASYALNTAQASSVLAIVAESNPATPNTVSITVDLNVSGNELAGTSATIRVGEYDTTVQAEIF